MYICRKCKAETERESRRFPGQGFCDHCAKNERRRTARRTHDDAMRMCGLVKVRGALGGVYWE